jgi:hypothetical protein
MRTYVIKAHVIAPLAAVALAGALGSQSCTATSRSSKAGVVGTTQGWATPRCHRTTPKACPVTRYYALQLKPDVGPDRTVRVSQAVFDHCQIGATYPTCADGATSTRAGRLS